MKLIIAIVQDQDEVVLSNAFLEANIRATKLSTTGGFLRAGNTTYLVGVNDEQVDDVLDIIRRSSSSRERYISQPMGMDTSIDMSSSPMKVEVGGATVFVLPVDGFYQF